MTAPESPELTGEQLRRIRVEELDMTQAELGDRLGLSVNTIARWEQGARAISMPRVVALALVTLIRWHGKGNATRPQPDTPRVCRCQAQGNDGSAEPRSLVPAGRTTQITRP